MDVALLQYIAAQQKQGIPSEEITQMLLARGWPLEAIDQGFKYISAHPNQVEKHEQIFSQKLRGPIDLLQAAFHLIKDHFWSVAFLSFVPTAITAVLIGFSIFVLILYGFNFFAAGNNLTPMISIVAAVIIFVILVGSIWLNAWCHVALYEILTVRNGKIGWREAMRKSAHKVISFGWILFLYGFIVSGGFLLLIIPGIILSIWFIFAPFVYILENQKGMNALLKSREYLRGMTMSVMLRIGFIYGVLFGVSLVISTIGGATGDGDSNTLPVQIFSFFVNLLMTPFILAYLYLLFENIRAIKGTISFTPTTGKKVLYLLIGSVGIISIIGSFYFFLKAVQTYIPSLLNSNRIVEYQTDTALVQNALDLYFIDFNQFPALLDELIPNYLNELPSDGNYTYTVSGDQKTYTLCGSIKSVSEPECVSSED